MRSFTVRKLVSAAAVGAVYAALTILLAPISYGPLQFRVAEVLCILPFFAPFSAWGLFIGCAVANLLSAYGLPDVVFGSLATLAAGLCTAAVGKKDRSSLGRAALACLMPVLWNGAVVGALIAAYSSKELSVFLPLFALYALQVALGEAAVLYFLGLPLIRILPKNKTFLRILNGLLDK